jgi:hypothetical protein
VIVIAWVVVEEKLIRVKMFDVRRRAIAIR